MKGFWSHLYFTIWIVHLNPNVAQRLSNPDCSGNGGSDKFQLPDNYSIAELPSKPTRVRLEFEISELVAVSDIKNVVEMGGSLSLRWNDSRVSALPWARESDGIVHLDLSCIETLWTPDVWIESLVNFGKHSVMGDLARLRITGENEIEYWQSVTLKISCAMNLDMYPLDNQACLIRFSSNGLEVSLQEYEGEILFSEDKLMSQGALQYESKLVPFKETFYPADCGDGKPCWPQIAATLVLNRYFKNHCLQVFVPTTCLVVLSWISFLIPPYIVPGRMVLLVTLLLVLFSSYSDAHRVTPKSNGVKVQDIWFIGCILFILGAIFEYAICLFLKRSITRQKRKRAMKRLREQERKITSNARDKLFLVRPAPSKDTIVGNHGPVEEEEAASMSPKKGNNPPLITDVPEPTKEQAWSREQQLIRLLTLSNPFKQSLRKTSSSTLPGGSSFGPDFNPGPAASSNNDSGNSYGDVNDTNMEGEEMLENIDYASLKLFPSLFALYMTIFWTVFLIEDSSN